MKTIAIQEFKKVLVEMSEEIRSKPVAPYFDGALMILGRQLKFLHEAEQKGEDIDMNKMREEIKAVVMTMADIPARTREGYWPTRIKEEAEKLSRAVSEWKRKKGEPKDKPVVAFNTEDIRSSHLVNVVKRLKMNREIEDNIKVVQRGNLVCLITD